MAAQHAKPWSLKKPLDTRSSSLSSSSPPPRPQPPPPPPFPSNWLPTAYMKHSFMSNDNRDAAVRTDDQQINLCVGERHFSTMRSTLTKESPFFASLLSGRWNCNRVGEIFVDADGNLFEHILRYLRRGVLPVFYDASRGHEHTLYLALLEEARYFQISRLVEWLNEKQYLRAVKTSITVHESVGFGELQNNVEADCEISYHPVWQTRKVFVCPRGIDVHRGKPLACGRACMKQKGDSEDIYEEDYILRTMVTKKHTFLDRDACLAWKQSDLTALVDENLL